MRLLVDVTHPAHVHLFRNAVDTLRGRGHEVGVVAREKDVTLDLLGAYGIEHTALSRARPGAGGTLREWVGRGLKLLRFARAFDPDVILSRLNPAAAHVAALLGVPNVVFHDTEVAGLLDRVTLPAAAVVATPAAFDRELPAEHVRYRGFHELAYLHPARFEPDGDALREHGVDPDEPYSVVRLVAMDAHHDRGRAGFPPVTLRRLVDGLAEHGDVYVTSESPLPADLDGLAPPVPVDAMHDLLAFADCYVGDSSTMATEAAVLGTPSVRYNPLGREMGNFERLGDAGLVRSHRDPEIAADSALELAADPDAGRRWRRRRRRLLAEVVDPTAFAVALVEEVAE
jgi:predicted glycosyltransferase